MEPGYLWIVVKGTVVFWLENCSPVSSVLARNSLEKAPLTLPLPHRIQKDLPRFTSDQD